MKSLLNLLCAALSRLGARQRNARRFRRQVERAVRKQGVAWLAAEPADFFERGGVRLDRSTTSEGATEREETVLKTTAEKDRR